MDLSNKHYYEHKKLTQKNAFNFISMKFKKRQN